MLLMKSLIAFVGLAIALVASTTFQQPHHSNLLQNATVVCSGNGTTYELIFFLEANGDTIQSVNQTDQFMTAEKTFSDTSGDILGYGTAEMPYNFTIIVNGMPPNGLELSAEAKYSLAVIDGDVLSVYVMAKSVFEAPLFGAAYFPEDVLYKATCNFTELADVWVSTGKIDVQGQIFEDPEIVMESAKMYVSLPPNPAPTSRVNIASVIQLNLALGTPTKALGLYARNCYICSDATCPDSRLSIPFIDADGCPAGNPISKFTVNPTNDLKLKTDPFQAFILSTGNEVYFKCQVNFCYLENDPRCTDFCAYSNTTNVNNRRRRSAEEDRPDEIVSAHITIKIDSDQADGVQLFRDHLLNSAEERAAKINDAPKHKKEPLVNNALLGLVIGLSAVLTIGLTAAVVVWCRASQNASLQKA